MGGFQKFPIPRYLHVSQWIVNRNWKWNTFHMFFPTAILCFMVWRNSMISTAKPPNYGEYVDPQSSVAPKVIKY
ncbi:hypothetical protein ABPG72_006692 [Tetrahymena utriculariae]